MSTLICGSIAFDSIMVFHDRFRNHILPEQIHILNVSFLVPEMRREFGGCAGNIAYNLKLLGGDPLIMATVGDDAGPYLERLDGLGLSRAHVTHVPGTYTAQAFITTDLDDNQITAFHPGAMTQSHLNKVSDARDVRLGIVAPDGRDGMLEHCRQFAEAGIPFIFDPGQGLPMFSGEELVACLQLADYCTVNDYEARLMCERTGRTPASLSGELKALIVTRGGEGSEIHTGGQRIDIPCVRPAAVEDPTGCGDAYRAGLLYGIEAGLDWALTGRLASLMGALKIASRGGQNHTPRRDEIAERFREAFGTTLW
ncbi:MAG TPA: carbohydrate kinase family protein [Zoogloea sp.]|uniref:carbohydrate kinase family protein n=1 Tax=Zoogloea sp. TaxID=49181 RepID=UPI002C7D02FB|nr:carbohydrate kinase family protein [Zoogloea sp.]HMV17191.1 carbohydrate kinase family protein [Rhodocyclaceae bacterium]HMV64180.1 carbohydrate kinase family protein [Rhodocyclaceae bacterium]HMW51821.1 carbohydrate kinase family protein [Rhodocyclaceae bacterium]HMY48583.1 carbohydrate kinase family protein [Rhodocyclaceae bacterium]HMZ74882.1 carbohydrate kinase family protein [Rhodocyclaceae bacterium]